MNLLTKYRPSTIDELLGQPAVAEALRQFCAAPETGAMLFHGESGVGKTSAAYALANGLGVAVEEGELGGWHEIASGEQTGESVRRAIEGLRFRPLFGSGWKLLVCNEADRMTTGAESIWLDALEHLPDRTVVVFTTNEPHRLSKRLRDRCDSYAFTSDRDDLQPAIQKLAAKIWRGEGLKGKPPELDTLGMPTLGDFDTMHASFRLAIVQLSRFVREAKQGNGDMAKVSKQVKRDQAVAKAGTMEAECDHCGKLCDVDTSRIKQKCPHCGKTFKIEL